MANEFKIKNGLLVSGSITGVTESGSDNSAKMASTSWVRNYVSANSGSISSTKTVQSFTATAGQTSFTITNGYTPGLLDIYLNGSFLNTSEYTATDGSAVVLTNAASLDDVIDVVKTTAFYVGTSPNARESYLYTATASQTTFAATYTPGQVDVFYNGAKLAPAEFTATNGTSVVLATAATSGDVVEIMGWLTGGGLTGTRTLTINGTTYDLSANRSWTVTDATKLPLSGGTLTGGLTGTSATFSDTVTINKASAISSLIVKSSSSTTGLWLYLNGLSATLSNQDDGSLSFQTNGIDRLTIASTGATTFSGVITASDNIKVYGANQFWFNSGFRGQIVPYNAYGGGTDYSPFFTSESSLAFGVGGNATKALNITSAGAATFSSSLSANVIYSNTDFRTDGGTVKVGAGSNNYYSQISTAYNYPYVDSYFDSVAGASYEGRISFRTSTAGGSLSTKVIIYNNGQVGIGTTSPNGYAKFEVSGNIMSSGPSTILMLNNTGGTAQSWWVGQDISGANDGIFYIYNQTSNSQAINIRKNNNVIVGMTTDTGNKFTVNGNIVAYGSTGGLNILGTYHTGNSTQYAWFNSGNGGMTLTHSGVANVGTFNMSSGAYTATSDVNKKKDFERSSLGLNEVLQLIPTLYRFKTEDSDASKHVGFIAQEVKNIIPQAYTETDLGNDKFIGLEYTAFIPVLVKAVQELKAENDQLKDILTRNNII